MRTYGIGTTNIACSLYVCEWKGELWFYDNYVIPLAKKLDECSVFGVASDEGLNYALANRQEWSDKGEEIVKEMLERYHELKEQKKSKKGRKKIAFASDSTQRSVASSDDGYRGRISREE